MPEFTFRFRILVPEFTIRFCFGVDQVALVTAIGTSVETMLGNFVYVYGVEMYGLSGESARDLNALSWGCQGMGRLIGILLSAHGLPP